MQFKLYLGNWMTYHFEPCFVALMYGRHSYTYRTHYQLQPKRHFMLSYIMYNSLSDLALNWMSRDKCGYLSEAIHAVLTMEDM